MRYEILDGRRWDYIGMVTCQGPDKKVRVKRVWQGMCVKCTRPVFSTSGIEWKNLYYNANEVKHCGVHKRKKKGGSKGVMWDLMRNFQRVHGATVQQSVQQLQLMQSDISH